MNNYDEELQMRLLKQDFEREDWRARFWIAVIVAVAGWVTAFAVTFLAYAN